MHAFSSFQWRWGEAAPGPHMYRPIWVRDSLSASHPALSTDPSRTRRRSVRVGSGLAVGPGVTSLYSPSRASKGLWCLSSLLWIHLCDDAAKADALCSSTFQYSCFQEVAPTCSGLQKRHRLPQLGASECSMPCSSAKRQAHLLSLTIPVTIPGRALVCRERR